jgi:sulfur carrier protein
MSKTIEIQVNGEATPVGVATLAELVQGQRLPAKGKGIAVALNDAVVPRARWPETALKAGDWVEIVRPIVGG